MLFVCTWLWGNKWEDLYVERLFAGVKRNLSLLHRTTLITDHVAIPANVDVAVSVPTDTLLMHHPGCLARIRMFSHDLQYAMGVQDGDVIANVDVDSVITGRLDSLFAGKEEFRIMQGYNTTNPCPFNGSLWMFQAGTRHDVWDDFSMDAVRKIPRHAVPDDQGWLHYKFPSAAAYTPRDGVYAFKKKTWRTGKNLPPGARIVTFPGRDPAKYIKLDWVQKHWQC